MGKIHNGCYVNFNYIKMRMYPLSILISIEYFCLYSGTNFASLSIKSILIYIFVTFLIKKRIRWKSRWNEKCENAEKT